MSGNKEAQAVMPGELRTACGREIHVGRFVLTDDLPIGRVTLRVECRRFEDGQLWASLTAHEARLLASYLLGQAEVIENDCVDQVAGGPRG